MLAGGSDSPPIEQQVLVGPEPGAFAQRRIIHAVGGLAHRSRSVNRQGEQPRKQQCTCTWQEEPGKANMALHRVLRRAAPQVVTEHLHMIAYGFGQKQLSAVRLLVYGRMLTLPPERRFPNRLMASALVILGLC